MTASTKMEQRLAELQARREAALAMGGPERIERQHAAGKLTARERIDALIDPGSFLEVGILARASREEEKAKSPADGVVTGYGRLNGRTIGLAAQDFTVMSGAGGKVGILKMDGVAGEAIRRGFPFVLLAEAGGARIPDLMGSRQFGLLWEGRSEGFIFSNRPGIPMVVAALGECFGDPSFHAGEADFVVMKFSATLAVSGPAVVGPALGENVTSQELGGPDISASSTGVAHMVVDTEEEAFEAIRTFLSFLPDNCSQDPPVFPTDDSPDRRADWLLNVIPDSPRRAYDMNDVVASIVDDGFTFPIRATYARSVITCLARLNGQPVGIIANQPMYRAGVIDVDAAEKMTSFVILCETYGLPIVFLHDQPGFLVGTDQEKHGILKKVMKLLRVLSATRVVKLGVVIRKTYGLAVRGMAGPGWGADFNFAWPTAEMSFMDPEVGVNVVHRRKIEAAADPEAMRSELIESWRKGVQPWDAAEAFYVDDIIDPRDTRPILIRALEIARNRWHHRERAHGEFRHPPDWAM